MSGVASRAPGRPPWRSLVDRRWARISAWFLAYLPDRSKARRPPAHLHIAAAVPAAALRSAVVLLGLVCSLTVVTGTPGWVVVIVLLIGLFCLPGSMVGGALIIALGLLMVFDVGPAPTWRTPLLVAAIPLLMQLAAIAGQTTLLARVELGAIAAALRRYLLIQVFAQLLALTGGMVAGLGWVLPQLLALAAVAVLALAAFWVPTLGPPRRSDGAG